MVGARARLRGSSRCGGHAWGSVLLVGSASGALGRLARGCCRAAGAAAGRAPAVSAGQGGGLGRPAASSSPPPSPRPGRRGRYRAQLRDGAAFAGPSCLSCLASVQNWPPRAARSALPLGAARRCQEQAVSCLATLGGRQVCWGRRCVCALNRGSERHRGCCASPALSSLRPAGSSICSSGKRAVALPRCQRWCILSGAGLWCTRAALLAWSFRPFQQLGYPSGHSASHLASSLTFLVPPYFLLCTR